MDSQPVKVFLLVVFACFAAVLLFLDEPRTVSNARIDGWWYGSPVGVGVVHHKDSRWPATEYLFYSPGFVFGVSDDNWYCHAGRMHVFGFWSEFPRVRRFR